MLQRIAKALIEDPLGWGLLVAAVIAGMWWNSYAEGKGKDRPQWV